MSPPPLDPRVRAFAGLRGDHLTARDIAEVLGPPFSKRTVERLMANEDGKGITAATVRHANGKGVKPRRSVSRGALLSFILASTEGPLDPLLEAIAQDAPAWLPYAERVAKKLQRAAEAHKASAALAADNVIDIATGKPRAKRPPADPYAGHPDLFPALSSAG